MTMLDARFAALSSPDLLTALDRLAAEGRELTADLIALLAECDGRKLYVAEGYESLFEFCVRRLRLSESQAYHRIQAARAARSFPHVLERLRAGRVTMTAVALLRDHLTDSNHVELLDWAEGRRKREIEVFVRTLDPTPAVPSSLRRLAPPPAVNVAADGAFRRRPDEGMAQPVPAPAVPVLTLAPPSGPAVAEPAGSGAVASVSQPRVPLAAPLQTLSAPVARLEIRPLSGTSYSLRVTISQETHDKLRRAQDLLGHTGAVDPAEVLERALTLLVAQLERRKAGAPRSRKANAKAEAARAPKPRHAKADAASLGPAKPRQDEADRASSVSRRRSRYIPAAVRRAVWERDGARCAFVSLGGVRCGATTRLEFHHRIPFADGGPTSVDNLAITCVRHNHAEASRWFNFDQTEFGPNSSRNPKRGGGSGIEPG